MNIECKQKKITVFGFVQMIVIEIMLCVYIWDAVSYERLAALSPYPILGRIIVVIRVLINFTLILFIYIIIKRIDVHRFVKKYGYSVASGLILIFGIILRLTTAQQYGALYNETQSIEYQIAKASLNLSNIAPEHGTLLESSMQYLAKNRLNSIFPLYVLPFFFRLFGSSSPGVHYANILIDTLNMMLLYFCAK